MDKRPNGVPHPFLMRYPFARVVGSYKSGLIRGYCQIRSRILRNRILSEIGQYIPFEGTVTELGCGFGLFALCFADTRPNCAFTCCDLSEGRIQEARNVANRLGIKNITFENGDAVAFVKSLPPQDCVYMLDLVHHLPPAAMEDFLQAAYDAVRPGGLLVVKDVATRPWHKMAFTWILDVLMTKGEIPNYWPPERFLKVLQGMGSVVHAHNLDDLLPYPHILYVCHKASQ